MDFPVALLLLRTPLLRLAAPLTLQIPMLDLPSYLPDPMNIHPTMGTQRQTWPHPFQLQLITRLQFFQDCTEEAYPLQRELSETRRQLHAYYLVEVQTPSNDNSQPALRRLMVTEVDQTREPSKHTAGVLLQWDHRPHSCWSQRMD